MFIGLKANLSKMHVFGTICYAHIQAKTKLDTQTEQEVQLYITIKAVQLI